MRFPDRQPRRGAEGRSTCRWACGEPVAPLAFQGVPPHLVGFISDGLVWLTGGGRACWVEPLMVTFAGPVRQLHIEAD